ncbi:MFS transporter [Patulibacter sp. SYSU D01012]|uniref:MFS transporter n=1 Tax=Patulibacter sp. SYSU D01012 TaxID=2817381 RepID=UPI001B310CA6|nr:MFS transporter [Patulibacter sp. SYSU D01012]
MHTTASPTPDHDRRRWRALVVLCFAQLMITLDTTIVNVALPAIQEHLDFSDADLSWVVNAFLVTFGGFLLLAGRLGDLLGRRRVYLVGLVVFTVASALCGLAESQGMLIGARLLQGVGAALQGAAILAIIATGFPEPQERARAMSAYVFVAVAGAALGLLAGGLLTEGISWRWIFLVNVPIGVGTIVVSRLLVDADEGLGLGDGLDWLGSVLITLAVMVGVFAVVGAVDHGWGSTRVLGSGAAALLLAGAFVLTELRVADPVLPLRILRQRGLMGASVVRALIGTGLFATFFLGTLYFENVLGYGPVQTGLAFLPWFLSLGVLSLGVTARLIARFGAMPVMVAGMLISIVGMLLFRSAGIGTAYFPTIALANLAIGTGVGLTMMPLLHVAMSDVAPADRGLGSGVITVAQQVGGALGLAVLSTLAATRTSGLVADGEELRNALVAGYRLAFVLGAGCFAAGIVVAVALLGRSSTPARRPVETPATPDRPVATEAS